MLTRRAQYQLCNSYSCSRVMAGDGGGYVVMMYHFQNYREPSHAAGCLVEIIACIVSNRGGGIG